MNPVRSSSGFSKNKLFKILASNGMNPLRKIIQKTGFDLHRYRPATNKLLYLKTFDFQTILDIGANTGQFALSIREILPKAQIYSFEPLKGCFEVLVASRAGDAKFKAFNYALGDKNEDVQMHKSAYSPSSSILEMSQIHKDLFPHTKEHTNEKIVIKKLDDVINELDLPVGGETLIKIDVQGFEDKVIAGGQNIFEKAKAVIIENSFVKLYENQPLFDDIYEKLKSLNFIYKGSLQEKINKETGEIISEDSLFIKSR